MGNIADTLVVCPRNRTGGGHAHSSCTVPQCTTDDISNTTLAVCPVSDTGPACSVRAPCVCGEGGALDEGSFVWLTEVVYLNRRWTIQIDISDVPVSTGCLFFSEHCAFLSSVSWNGTTPDPSGCVEPGNAENSYTLALDSAPPDVHFFFFVALVQPGSFVEAQRSQISVVDSAGKQLCSFERNGLGDGNAMVMLAVVRSQIPQWRAEAVGRVYHLFGNREPLGALGRHLETLANASPRGGRSREPGLEQGKRHAFPVSQHPALPSSRGASAKRGDWSGSNGCSVFFEGDQHLELIHELTEQDAIRSTRLGHFPVQTSKVS